MRAKAHSCLARTRCALITAALVACAAPVSAQTEVTLLAGVHLDRVTRPDRHLDHVDGGQMLSASGEAPAVGLRLTHWLRPIVGLEGEVAFSRNRSWYGSTPFPHPEFSTQKVFTSLRLTVRTSPRYPVQLDVGAGPALIIHGGEGKSYLERRTNVGAVGALGARTQVGEGLALRLTGLAFYYSPTYTEPYQELGGGILGAGKTGRLTGVILSGLTYTFR